MDITSDILCMIQCLTLSAFSNACFLNWAKLVSADGITAFLMLCSKGFSSKKPGLWGVVTLEGVTTLLGAVFTGGKVWDLDGARPNKTTVAY